MDGMEAHGMGRPEPQTGEESSERAEESMSDATFDRWLTHHLRRLYDPIVNEPIPADLIRALESRLK